MKDLKEVDIIAREHQQLVREIDEINDAVIDLKRDHLFQSDQVKYACLVCATEVIRQARTKLISFLDKLIGKQTEEDGPALPPKLLKKIKGQFPDLTKLNKQFKIIRKELEEGKTPSADHFHVLDKIVTELDMERSKSLKI